MAAFPLIITKPALGQVNVAPAEQQIIEFLVLLEWNKARPEYPFEVHVCFASAADSSRHESTWKSAPATTTDNPHVVEYAEHEVGRIATFVVRMKRSEMQALCPSGVVNFTVKYRVDKRAPWQFVSSQAGTSAGTLVLQIEEAARGKGLEDILNLDSAWNVASLPSDEKGAKVFKLESSEPIPKTTGSGDEEELHSLPLGKVQNILRYFALVRAQPYWLEPRHGRDFFYTAEDALICSFLTTSGQILTLVTITGQDSTYSVLQSDSQGRVVVSARCDSDKDVKWHALAAVSSTFEESCSAVMAAARQIVNGTSSKHDPIPSNSTKNNAEAQRKIEQWLDGLAFCTWNGLGQSLTQAKILASLNLLLMHNVRISTLLIDDNWQTLGPLPDQDYEDSFRRGFADLQANADVAPKGLETLITKIKSTYPHILDIGVWHALLGYWGGISPTGQIAQTYQTTETPSYLMGNQPTTITSIAAPDLPRFYTDFYTYLSTAGITFIKTDVQHMLSTLRSAPARRALIPAYQSAWTAAHTRFFSSKAISCMSQIPEILYSSLLNTSTPRIPLRNSDDFYPEIPASHPWHIWTNAHNALFTRHLNVTPDWDMFQTTGEYASYHAAARCVSGGPVMITDVPGEHGAEVLQEIVAVDASARSVTLRPGVAASMRVFDEYRASGGGGAEVLRVGSVCANGEGLLGVWNVAERAVACFVDVGEVCGVREMRERGFEQVVIRSHKSKATFVSLRLADVLDGEEGEEGVRKAVKRQGLLYVNLPVRGWDVFTVHPVHRVKLDALAGAAVAIAVVGLWDKISGAAAIVENWVSARDGSKVVFSTTLKALGSFAVWLDLPSGVRLTNCCWRAPKHDIGGVFELRTDSGTDVILSLDLVSQWLNNGLFEKEAEAQEIEIEATFERYDE